MAKQSYLDHLAQVPLFSACNKKELGIIAKAGTEVTQPDGKVLATQGDVSTEAFVVVSGEVAVHRNKRKVATLGPGAMVGELGLLDQGPRTATLTTVGPTTLLVLGPREFSGLLDEVPTIARKVLKALAARVRDLDTKAFG